MPQTAEIGVQDAEAYKSTLLRWFVLQPPKKRFALTAFIRADDDGFTAIVPLLPGGVSSGQTLEEAKANIQQACAGLIEEYVVANEVIPWRAEPLPEDALLEGDVLFAFTIDA